MTRRTGLAVGTRVRTFASWSNTRDRSVRCTITELPSGSVQLYRVDSTHWLCGFVYRARNEFTVDARAQASGTTNGAKTARGGGA